MGGSQSAAADSEEQAPKEEPAQPSEACPAEQQNCPASASQLPSKGTEEADSAACGAAIPEVEATASAGELSTEASIKVDQADTTEAAEPAEHQPASNDAEPVPSQVPVDATDAVVDAVDACTDQLDRQISDPDAHEEDTEAAAPTEEAHGADDQAPTTATDAPEAKNARSLEQQMSLRPTDDERTEISKKISWILRHGAKKVNVNIDENGWVNVTDLLHSDILGGTTEDKLLAMINESNVQKTRYEMEDDPNGGKRIRAISKSRRNAAQREMRERERREREKRKEEDAREREARDREMRERQEQRDRDPVREAAPFRGATVPVASITKAPQEGHREGQREGHRRRPHDQPGWWDEQWQQDGPTYEEQIKEGFLPVYQGSKLVAMARENETVRPGRRTERPPWGGKGFDPSKGFDGKGFEGKGFDGKGFDGKGYDMQHKGDNKGERKGRGKEDRGKGKMGDDGKGFHHSKGDSYKGEGYKSEGYRAEEKPEEEHGEALKERYRSSRQLRWRAVNDKEIIVRVGLGTETDIVGTLMRNSLVAQVGEDKMLKNGIARMFIESIDPIPGIKGWVTRSAEAAGGPVFFKPDRGAQAPTRERGKDGKGGKGNQQFGGEKGEKGGKALDGKGKARRPIGEGEGGPYNKPINPAPGP